MIIRDNLQLPKNILLAIATIGWIALIYLAWVVLADSWERSYFAIGALMGQIPTEINPFIDRYTAHPIQTLVHTGAGLVFAVLGPLQFVAPLRERFPLAHRVSGRIFLPFGIASGIAALAMGLAFPVWGSGINQVITTGFALFMTFCFVKAFLHIRKRQIMQHRRWMIRGFALGMSVAFFRVLLEDLLPAMGHDFNSAWNLSMWTCFPVLWAVAEFWIWATSPKKPKPRKT